MRQARFFILFAAMLSLAFSVVPRAIAQAATQPAASGVIRVLLVGDSTVTDKDGWGTGFRKMFEEKIEIENLSRGGRSSKSFRGEGHWDQAIKMKADYILIQFGHNDCPGKGPERETDAATEFRDNMRRYVEEARAAGMKPVLLTSLCRRAFDANGKIRPTSLAPYVDSTRKVAAELKAPLIDLDARSSALCNELGTAKCEAISQPPKEEKPDITHLNAEGSVLFGKLVAEDLAALIPEFKPHLRVNAK